MVSMGITKNVCLMTDKTLANLPPVKIVADALRQANVEFEIFDDVNVSKHSALHGISKKN